MSKAPDKIYILPMQNQADGCVGVAWRDKHGKMTEYIRKDALLEWIHTELDAIEGKEEMSQMELAFTEVIDKIQRM